MNKIVAVSAAAAVPVAAPSIASEGPQDAALVELGHRFDAIIKDLREAREMVDREAGNDREFLAIEASDPLTRAIRREPAYSRTGLGVKAKAAALNSSHFWNVPFRELDWDEEAARHLIDDTLKAAGLPPVEAYLGDSIVSARPHPDAKFLMLADQYLDAQKRFRELQNRVDQMVEEERRQHFQCMPEALRWFQTDTELGLPDIRESKIGRELAWDCEAFVGKLRKPKWLFCTVDGEDGDDERIAQFRKVVPSAEARARADEIIAAFDAWNLDRKMPRGYRKLVREQNRADKAWGRLEVEIRDTRASTVEGMIAKMRCARAYECWVDDDIQDGPPHTMALSIMDDLQALVKTA